MVGCAYEEHDAFPVLLHKTELEERDCSNQFEDGYANQRGTVQQLRHKVVQLGQLTLSAGETAAANARYLELLKENEQLKQSVAVHRAEVRVAFAQFSAVIVTSRPAPNM